MSTPAETAPNPEPAPPDRPGRSLVTGALIFRWVWLIWMGSLAASSADSLQRPALAWASIGAAGAWTAYLTARRSNLTRTEMLFDVALSTWLIVASGLVVEEGGVVSGRPFFATGFPLSTPLLWGATRGLGVGLATGAVLAVAHLLTRPINAVSLSDLSPTELQNVAGAMLNYLVAGFAVGLVSRLLRRSAEAVRTATEELVREREYTARLAEREAMAREIHDSVLQSLAFVHKRGRELASSNEVPAEEVAKLADMAGREEGELRALILRDPARLPAGEVSLREALEEVARKVEGVPVSVSCVGPLYVDGHVARETAAATRQALENVVRHAQAGKASVFAEEDGDVVVTVRDDGVGFVYDEAALQQAGKVGLLRSVKGRMEDLGGTMQVASSEKGTEITLTIPADRTDGR